MEILKKNLEGGGARSGSARAAAQLAESWSSGQPVPQVSASAACPPKATGTQHGPSSSMVAGWTDTRTTS